MKVTIRQIAEQAGVSRGTVDRVLNNRGRVRPEVEERVRKIAAELGYKPNLLGRALIMSRNNMKIGVIIQAAETPFMKTVQTGVEKARDEVENMGGLVLIRRICRVSASETLRAMEELKGEGICALALMPVEDEGVKERIDVFVQEYGIPVVTFNSDVQNTKRICFVGQNGIQCGRTAAGLMGEIFGRNGATAAVISGYEENTSLSNRVTGFCEEIRKSYPSIHLLDIRYCYEDESNSRKIMEEILDECPELDAVYMTCYGENGVCEALRERGKAKTVTMIASDLMGKNYEHLRSGDINLLIGQDGYTQGYEPVMILYRLIFNGEKPKSEHIYTDIVIKNRFNI